MSIVERLKSPVVLLQLITIIATVAVFYFPQFTEDVKVIVGAVSAVINVIAGLNDPTNANGF